MKPDVAFRDAVLLIEEASAEVFRRTKALEEERDELKALSTARKYSSEVHEATRNILEQTRRERDGLGLELKKQKAERIVLLSIIRQADQVLSVLQADCPELWGDKVEDGIVRHYFKEDTLSACFQALDNLDKILEAEEKREEAKL